MQERGDKNNLVQTFIGDTEINYLLFLSTVILYM